MGCIKKPWFNTLAVLVCLLGLTGISANMAFAADEIGGWKWKADASVGLSYDTNIYKLSATQSDRKDQKLTKDQTAGRYKDMDSVDDFIFTPRVSASFARPGLMGKDFSLMPSVAYNVYLDNKEKNYFDFGLDLNQSLGRNGNLGLEFGYAPNIFKKNFLSGTVDTNGDGPITAGSEKVFSPAHYDDATVTLSYGRRLWKSNKKVTQTLAPKAVSGKALVGYNNRSYDDPFTIRSEDSFFAGFNLKIAMHKNTSLTMRYLFKKIDTTVDTELLIRNETNFGVDLNGDGDKLDLSVATNQKVDRSRNSHTIGAKVSTRLAKDWSGYAKYEARFTSYKSEETFDVTRLNRNDIRQRVGLGLKGQLAPRWTLALSWLLTHNNAARDGLALVDKTEAKSYDKNVFSAIISYRL